MYLPSGDQSGCQFVSRPLGDLNRIASTHLLNPDVKLAASVGTVGDEATIRRPGGPELQAIIKSETRERPLSWQRRRR